MNISVWLMTPLTPRNGTQAMARISVEVQKGMMKARNSTSRQRALFTFTTRK